MNKFLLGLSLGAAVGYGIAYVYIRRRYEVDITEQRQESYKNGYAQGLSQLNKEAKKDILKPISDSEEEKKVVDENQEMLPIFYDDKKGRDLELHHKKLDYEYREIYFYPMYHFYMDVETEMGISTWEWPSEVFDWVLNNHEIYFGLDGEHFHITNLGEDADPDLAEPVFPVHRLEFNRPDIIKESLRYFDDDDTLVDNLDNPVHDRDRNYGYDILTRFGELSGDRDIVFCFNPYRQVLSSITLLRESYADVMYNVIENDEPLRMRKHEDVE